MTGASTAVAIIVRREKDLVAHFRTHGAIDAGHAMTPGALGVDQRLAWTILREHAIILEATSGAYYLDELAWETLRSRRQKIAVVVLVVALAVILVSVLVVMRR